MTLDVVIVPQGHFGVGCFSFWRGFFQAVGVCFDKLGIGFRGTCYMETLPFARSGMWDFSLLLCLHRILGV